MGQLLLISICEAGRIGDWEFSIATLDATYHYYYNGQQMVETRNGSDLTIKQNVWGLSYIDELVQTSLNDDPADFTEQDCESNYYAMQDANYNVLGMADPTGILIERYEYTPYGQRQVYTSSGLNDPLCYTPISTSKPWQIAGTPGIAQPYSLNATGHQGLFHDEEINLIYNRARELHPTLGRFMQRDPLEYIGGSSMYQYVSSNPLYWLDPSGLDYFTYTITERPLSDGGGKIEICYRITQVVQQNWLGWWLGWEDTYEKSVGTKCQDVCPDDVAKTRSLLNRFLSRQVGDLNVAWAYDSLADAEAQAAEVLAKTGLILAGGAAGKAARALKIARQIAKGTRQSAKQAAKSQFRKEAAGLDTKMIRSGRDGTGKVVGAGTKGRGGPTYRPKSDGSYSVGRSGDIKHFRPTPNGGHTVN